MTQLQMRCHALQERFDDQSATLRLARENHGDMQVSLCLYTLPCTPSYGYQERLITAETAFSVRRFVFRGCMTSNLPPQGQVRSGDRKVAPRGAHRPRTE